MGENSMKTLDTVGDIYARLYVLLGVCVLITIVVRKRRKLNGR